MVTPSCNVAADALAHSHAQYRATATTEIALLMAPHLLSQLRNYIVNWVTKRRVSVAEATALSVSKIC